MSHKNYYEFESDSHYDLGLQIGRRFRNEAIDAIAKAKKDDWEHKLEIGKRTLESAKRYFPEYVEELRGYADGAEVDFLDLWVVSIEADAEKIEESKCTTVITNNGKLIAHNEDESYPNLEDKICILKKSLNGITTLEIYYFNTLGGNAVGINSKGYALTINSLMFTEQREEGIPKNVIARYLLDTSDPIDAFGNLLKLPRMSGYNANISDKNGHIINIELTPEKGVISSPNSPFVHSNHCLKVGTEINDLHGTISRLEVASDNVKPHMETQELISLMNDTSRGKDKSINNERNIGKMIIDMEMRVAKIWLLSEKELGWVDYKLDFIK